MDERVLLAVFLIVFLTIYGALNYYVLFKISKLLRLDRNLTFYIILAICTISYLIANILASKINSLITQAVYYIASAYMGIVFITFCLLLVYDLISLITPLPSIATGVIILSIVLILGIYSIINANTLQITKINIKSPKIDKQLSIVQISDVHLGAINGKHFLSRIIEKTNKLNPDLVLITGDLLDGRFKYTAEDFQELNKLKGEVYFTTGNHETYAGMNIIEELLNNTKVKMIRNEMIATGGIDIIGIDDSEDINQVKNHIKQFKINSTKYTILMYHRPIGVKDAFAAHIDLMLSGHTHGGQIFPFNYLIALGIRPVSGLHQIGMNEATKSYASYIYVTDGTGTWGPPMRLGTKAEIANILISPK